jgi:hypothetical protein
LHSLCEKFFNKTFNKMDELDLLMKRKNDLLKGIEEKRRLMELIKNPNIKNTLQPYQQMKRIKSATKIQVKIY